jgi:hypothetical protein
VNEPADDVVGVCPEAVPEDELAPVGTFNDPTGWVVAAEVRGGALPDAGQHPSGRSALVHLADRRGGLRRLPRARWSDEHRNRRPVASPQTATAA